MVEMRNIFEKIRWRNPDKSLGNDHDQDQEHDDLPFVEADDPILLAAESQKRWKQEPKIENQQIRLWPGFKKLAFWRK